MKRKRSPKTNFVPILGLAIAIFAATAIFTPKPSPPGLKPTSTSTPVPTQIPTTIPTQVPTVKAKVTRTGAPFSWSQQKLVKTDFLAAPKKDSPRLAESKVGLVVSWLPVIKSHSQNGSSFVCIVGIQKFQPYAQFVPRESWIKSEAPLDIVLRHEQLHFDISEIYARRLRAKSAEIIAMTETASANEVNAACQAANSALSSRIDPIINDIGRQEEDMQAQLDSNPNSLDIQSHTAEWEMKVRQHL